MDLEKRIFTVNEFRAVEDNGIPKITGYAALFNVWSQDLGGFVETIEPGAFTRSLQNGADVRAVINHDPNLILGRSKAGTLNLVEDDIGLRVEIVPPDTQYARDLMTSIKRGDIDQMSFQFKTIDDDVRWDGNLVKRSLKQVDLFDVAPVTFPAYPQTSVSVRSRIEALQGPTSLRAESDVVALEAERQARFQVMRKRLAVAEM